MGLIHIELFATLDLVGQGARQPRRGRTGEFPVRRLASALMDEVAGATVLAAYEGTDALLLGQRTYDIFAAYWPHQEGGEDNQIAALFNSVEITSSSTHDRPLVGQVRKLSPDLAGACARSGTGTAREEGRREPEPGADAPAREALRPPRPLGAPGRPRRRRRCSTSGAVPNVTLLEPPVAGPKGTVYLRYGLADGTPGTGDMSTCRPRCPARRLRPPRARWVPCRRR